MATSALTGSVASGSLKTNFPFSSNDTITFGTKKNSNPLPVSLLDFNAECIDKGVTLEWATASETNNDFFTIEKSDNATDWEKLGEVDGAGNSTIRTNYSFTDNNNANTAKYYRLKQTDFNGEYKYFTPLAIECGGMDNMNVEIYPNPFQQQVYLNISNLSTPIVHVTICNIVGKVIYEQHFDNIQGQRLFASFNLQDMDCGMYFIEVNCGANKRNFKIVKDQKE
jgi:hypothetical protein